MSHDPIHSRSLIARLRALCEPVAERFGCEVVAVELMGGSPGRGRLLRISIDKPGGAGIAECTRTSRALSPLLDETDLVAGQYDLEVSTPGMERPLQLEKDFVYFTGCDVRFKLWGVDARRRLKGRLLGVESGLVTVENEQGRHTLPLEDIERAHLVLSLEQYARLGQGLHPIEGEAR